MVDKIISDNANDADVILAKIPYDKTSSFGKGADKGPDAIVNCLDEQIELYERFTKWNPSKHLKIASIPLNVKDVKPELMAKEVSSKIKKFIEKDKFIISLGGEHSISAGIFDAWSKSKSSNKITILQIDAHLDLRDDDSDYNPKPSKYAHSCVMKRALGMGFKIVPVGIRAYADFELETAKNKGIAVFEWPRTEDKQLIKNILKEIKTDNVYLTLDADGIDPAHMPATGTPVQGGLSWKFTFELLKEVFEKKNVIGADIVEVSPRDNDSLTEYGAAQICHYMIALKFKDKKIKNYNL